jgi:hypothetical protein
MLILLTEAFPQPKQVKWGLMGYGLSYESNVTFFQMDKSVGMIYKRTGYAKDDFEK